MEQDLTILKDDMVAFIEGHGLRRFSAYVSDEVSNVPWSTDEDHPEAWKDFVELAKASNVVHGDKAHVGRLGQFDKILPCFRVVFVGGPGDVGDFIAHIGAKTAQTVALNKGDHVIFENCQVLFHAELRNIISLSSGKD